MNKKKITFIHAFVITTIFGLEIANAGNVTNTTKATANLAASCQLTVNDAVFGVYNPGGTEDMETTQKMMAKCTKNTVYTLHTAVSRSAAFNGITGGAMYAAPVNASILVYQVFDPKTMQWKVDTSGATTGYSGIGNGDWQQYSYQYKILKSQFVIPGNYIGSTTMTVSF